MGKRKRRKSKFRWGRVVFWSAFIIVLAGSIGLLFWLLPSDDIDVETLLNEEVVIETEPVSHEHVMSVPEPDIDVQLLSYNEWSRPGIDCDEITCVVIHYLGNPKTTAQENHDYFESLKNNLQYDVSNRISMSANYIVGIDGEIIECVPPGEVAYASNSANSYSVSIENCHVDDTGRLTEATYESLVHLTAYVMDMFDLDDRDDILRHYDITGKDCPRYYVANEDKWEQFKDDVMDYLNSCKEEVASKAKAKAKAQAEEEAETLEKLKKDIDAE